MRTSHSSLRFCLLTLQLSNTCSQLTFWCLHTPKCPPVSVCKKLSVVSSSTANLPLFVLVLDEISLKALVTSIYRREGVLPSENGFNSRTNKIKKKKKRNTHKKVFVPLRQCCATLLLKVHLRESFLPISSAHNIQNSCLVFTFFPDAPLHQLKVSHFLHSQRTFEFSTQQQGKIIQ